jgi:hypothetical protein
MELQSKQANLKPLPEEDRKRSVQSRRANLKPLPEEDRKRLSQSREKRKFAAQEGSAAGATRDGVVCSISGATTAVKQVIGTVTEVSDREVEGLGRAVARAPSNVAPKGEQAGTTIQSEVTLQLLPGKESRIAENMADTEEMPYARGEASNVDDSLNDLKVAETLMHTSLLATEPLLGRDHPSVAEGLLQMGKIITRAGGRAETPTLEEMPKMPDANSKQLDEIKALTMHHMVDTDPSGRKRLIFLTNHQAMLFNSSNIPSFFAIPRVSDSEACHLVYALLRGIGYDYEWHDYTVQAAQGFGP